VLRIAGIVKRDMIDRPGRLLVRILTPYHAQRRALDSALRDVRHGYGDYVKTLITTVDSAQGTEAEVVILSMTRTHSLGFLEGADERTLVACSRSKHILLVLAHEGTFRDDQLWNQLAISRIQCGISFVQCTDTQDRVCRRYQRSQAARDEVDNV
jgi:superfamily I DNA and/or RNA helicase